ncbi:MAG: long-chain fatty acid--CoA ligase [Planctomycetes bacterium]|jgi:long-chain acyl-CoA synthetase|nr:long-chain fatty acid--CoA ligase [Planctomycetota bacterium]
MSITLPLPTTIPDLLIGLLNRTPCSAALSWREAGYWRRLATEEVARDVRRCALGLIKLGVKAGDSVGLLAPSSPHWVITDLAIMSIGAISVPLFPNLSLDHLLYESDNTDMQWLIAIGAEQWRLVEPHARRWRAVVVKQVADLPKDVLSWGRLLELGDELSEQDSGLFARRRDHLTPDAVATIIHTSGSTGQPKGVVLTHKNLMSQISGAKECFPLDPTTDRALSVLPLAHVFERIVVYTYLAQGVPIAFGDDPKNTGVMLKEIRPTIMSMVPRLIEKLYARIVKRFDEASWPKRQLGLWALEHALKDDPLVKKPWTMDVADTLVYQRLREALGGRLKALIVGGAALAPDLGRFLTNVGVPVYCGYGMTESSPVISLNRPSDCRLGTVGKTFPGVQVRITADGEILAKGPNIMRGYHRDPEATAKTITPDGWLHTGDLGRFDADGYLIITGRVKELLKNSNGKYVCPVPIEHALCGSPLVDQAMVVAEGRPFTAALLFTEADALQRGKERLKLKSLSDEQFLASDAVKAEMRALLEEVNTHLDRWERIHAFRFVLKPLTVGEELTPTMKIKRHVVAAMYHDQIEQMYQEAAATVA